MGVRKFVGATARSMGSDPAYVATNRRGDSAVFSRVDHARAWSQSERKNDK